MELLALGKPIKKPPRSDERDGELFCGTYDSATLSSETLAPSVGSWFTKKLTAASDTIYVLRIYNTDYRNGSVVSSTGDILLYRGADTSDMTAVVHCSPGQSMTYSFRKTVNSNATSYLVTIQ